MKYEVSDFVFPEYLLEEAFETWPTEDWPHWFRYDDKGQRGKLTCHQTEHMSEACRRLLGRMALNRPAFVGPDAIPDLSLYGGGMHHVPVGSYLDVHLDADRHSRYGMARVASSILFIGSWQKEWGGRLRFWSYDAKQIESEVLPADGRLVTFASDDFAYHSVEECAAPRRTLAIFWYKKALGPGQRLRATFR